MKKLLLLGTLLLLSTIGFSQTDTNLDTIKKVKTLENYLHSTDKFTGEKVYYSNLLSTISIAKYINKNSSRQNIYISVNGSTLNYGCYGLSVLFENGKQINRPNEKVDTNYSDGWSYSASFNPTTYEINLFKTYRVVAVKLYIYDSDVLTSDADEFKEAANVMLKTPIKKKK